jgi:hypothetical protein
VTGHQECFAFNANGTTIDVCRSLCQLSADESHPLEVTISQHTVDIAAPAKMHRPRLASATISSCQLAEYLCNIAEMQ